mmetsp:Transcript_18335/g.20381  ORF Transcript_18335/g.20381 Transcript_18335/m.20381 type:complete len:496 (+) Transcript_18335:6-1493(+)
MEVPRFPIPTFPVLYAINLRAWLYRLSKKYRTGPLKLKDVPLEEFKAIKDRGFDIIYFVGLWELGTKSRELDMQDDVREELKEDLHDVVDEDIIGSPYAIREYVCNSELGTDADIKMLKVDLNAMGLFLMADFVPNNTAIDSVWSHNKEYYITVPANTPPMYKPEKDRYHEDIAYGWSGVSSEPWRDTLQLNYFRQQTRRMMIDNLLRISELCDGVRCDMAHLCLNEAIKMNWKSTFQDSNVQGEFWEEAITAVKKKNPNFIFFGEAYAPWQTSLQELGFNFVYHRDVSDLLIDGHMDNLRGYLSSQSIKFLEKTCHFTENVDEPRSAAAYQSIERSWAAALIVFTLPGMRLVYQGQEYGLKNNQAIQLRRADAETPNFGVVREYYNLLKILNTPVFKCGEWSYVKLSGYDSTWRLIGWTWRLGHTKRLCVMNYTDTPGSGIAVLPNTANDRYGNDEITVTELLTGVQYKRSANAMRTTGLHVIIQPWSGQIFQY